MGDSKSAVWAIAENVVRRGASALITLVLVYALNADDVGYFNACVIAVGAYQVIVDTSVRQVGYATRSDAQSFDRVMYYLRWLAVVGSLLILLCVVVIGATNGVYPAGIFAMVPIAFWPVAASLSAPKIVSLQVDQRWREVARIRFWCTTAALVVVVPATLVTKNVVAASIFLPIVEVLVWLMLKRVPEAALGPEETRAHPPASSALKMLAGMGIFQSLAWLSQQADRVVVVLLGSLSTLGFYSLALAVARAPVDALVGGLNNHHRTRLASARSIDDTRSLVLATCRRGIVVVVPFVVLSMIVGLLIPTVFGPEWVPASVPVVILAWSALPSVFYYILAATLVHHGSFRLAQVLQSVGVACGVLAGILVTVDLELGSVAVVGREFLLSVGAIWVARRYVAKSLFVLWIACQSVVAIAVGIAVVLAVT